MTISAPRLPAGALLGIAAILAIAGCQQNPRPRASASASAACRTEVDRVYATQNRADLSYRDQRDTPFAAGYLAGNTTQGLGAEYGRDNMYASCLNDAAGPQPAAAGTPGAAAAAPARAAVGGSAPAANIGSTFSPVVR